MKNIISIFFILVSINAFSQQKSFEFFMDGQVTTPFPKDYKNPFTTNGSSIGVDKNGIQWTNGTKNGKTYITNKTDTILIDRTPFEKAGSNYSFRSVSVNELNTKTIFVSGGAYVGQTYFPEYAVITVDTDKNIKYYFPKTVNDADTISNWSWREARSVGNNLVIQTNNKFIFGAGPYLQVSFASLGIPATNYYYMIEDLNGTLYSVTYDYSQYYIVAFYVDGTYQRLLPDAKIAAINFEKTSKTLLLYSSTGIYEVKDKTMSSLDIPDYATLGQSKQIFGASFSSGNYTVNTIVSNKGFSVDEGNGFNTYVFANDPLIGRESIRIDWNIICNLQPDSTLVFCYSADTTHNEDNLYLFTYKKGKSKFLKYYNFNQLKIQKENITYYVTPDKTYLYAWSQYNDTPIYQINDTGKTAIFANGYECNMFGKSSLKADKDYLWVDINPGTSNPANCDYARMRHNTYFVRGNIFYDSNKNGLKENSELGYSNAQLIALPSGLKLFPDKLGNFAFQGEQGVKYILKMEDSLKYSWIKYLPLTNSVGVKLLEEKPEVNTSFVLPASRCNTTRLATVSVSNIGAIPLEKIIVKFFSNGKFQLQENGLAIDTVKKEFINVLSSTSTTSNFPIQWADASEVGQVATLGVITQLYSNNQLLSEKKDSVQTIIRCSYDPNDKSVTPVGEGNKKYVLTKDKQQFLIRFENTGNDTAYHVAVHDVISPNLDLKTLEILGTSHAMNAEVMPNREVVFHFNYIMLPDSTTNKENAQGYVRFAIKPVAGLADETIICNKAEIVFDENSPVITNEICNTLVESFPFPTAVLEQSMTKKGTVYPNPASQQLTIPAGASSWSIFNTFGQKIISAQDEVIDISSLSDGIYTIKITYADHSIVERFVVKK